MFEKRRALTLYKKIIRKKHTSSIFYERGKTMFKKFFAAFFAVMAVMLMNTATAPYTVRSDRWM